MPAKVGSASDVNVGGGDRRHETDRAAGVADVHPEVDDLGTQLRGQVGIEDEAQTHARHPDPRPGPRPATVTRPTIDARCGVCVAVREEGIRTPTPSGTVPKTCASAVAPLPLNSESRASGVDGVEPGLPEDGRDRAVTTLHAVRQIAENPTAASVQHPDGQRLSITASDEPRTPPAVRTRSTLRPARASPDLVQIGRGIRLPCRLQPHRGTSTCHQSRDHPVGRRRPHRRA